jgi:hypothetical protein
MAHNAIGREGESAYNAYILAVSPYAVNTRIWQLVRLQPGSQLYAQ